MSCPHCANPNPDGAAVCPGCGKPLAQPALPHDDVANAATLDGAVQLSDLKRELEVHTTLVASATPRPAAGATAAGPAIRRSPTGTNFVISEGLELGHRYRIVRLLGKGGMGGVYHAHDKSLERDVALKVIRSDIADDAPTLERFKREIALQSKITHRNILRVYDLGEADGIKFLTMQYVEGEDLAAVLRREGKLPIDRIVTIFRQACAGVAAAHEQGVIHRDLKPQNIMIEASGTVLVTDFGVAKAKRDDQSRVSVSGTLIGTPAYMSPEQVKGEGVDNHSDIYSLGVILYEMATGKVPFEGASAYEVMIQRLTRDPPRMTSIDPALPAWLEEIQRRCMAREPRRRYQRLDELLADLDSGATHGRLRAGLRRKQPLALAAAGLLLAALLAVGGWIQLRKPPPPPSTPQPQTVLIADFRNRTGDPLFDGTLEPALTTAMEGAQFISTFNRVSARRIAAQLQPGVTALEDSIARLVATREGIHVVVNGAIDRNGGGGYHVSVWAVDAATGKPIINADADVGSGDKVLAAVAKLAATVRSALGDKTPESLQLAAAETFTTTSLPAAHEFGLGQELLLSGRYDDSVRHFLRALEHDMNLARAYAGLAVIEANRKRPSEAEKYFKLAMARVDRMSEREKYRTRGAFYLFTRQPEKAIEEFTALLDKYPADSSGLGNLALAYSLKRDMARALQEGRRGLEIYPKNVLWRANVGLYAMYAGDFEAATTELNRVVEMNPKYALAYAGLAMSELGRGRCPAATDAWKRLEALGPDGASTAALGLADLALYEGRIGDAASLLEKAIEVDLAAKNPDGAALKLTALADALLAAGRTTEAVSAAARALTLSEDLGAFVLAGRVFAAAGDEKRTLEIATNLERRLEPEPPMYARLLRADLELKRSRATEAISLLEEAKRAVDGWLIHFDLGRAYLEAGSLPQAEQEFELCVRRRGESTAIFLDEVPTSRLYPAAHYYLGRIREALGKPSAAESYRAFVQIKERGQDPLLADARRRGETPPR